MRVGRSDAPFKPVICGAATVCCGPRGDGDETDRVDLLSFDGGDEDEVPVVVLGGTSAKQEAGDVGGTFRLGTAQDVEHGDWRIGGGDAKHVDVPVAATRDMLLEALFPGRQLCVPGGAGTAAREQRECQQPSQRKAEWFNRLNSVALTTGVAFKHTPTVTGDGTVLFSKLTPGGTNTAVQIGNTARASVEWVLKKGTTYLMRVTNTSGGNAVVNPVFEFYEE